MAIIKIKNNDSNDIEGLNRLFNIDTIKCVNACRYYLYNISTPTQGRNDALNLLARCYYQLGDTDASLNCLHAVFAQDRYNIESFELLNKIYMNAISFKTQNVFMQAILRTLEKLNESLFPAGTSIDRYINDAERHVVDFLTYDNDNDKVKILDRHETMLAKLTAARFRAENCGYKSAFNYLYRWSDILDRKAEFVAEMAKYAYLGGDVYKAWKLACRADEIDPNNAIANNIMQLIELDKGFCDGHATVWHIDPVIKNVNDTMQLVVHELFKAKRYALALHAMQQLRASSDSRLLCYRGCAEYNLGNAEAAKKTFMLARDLYGDYSTASSHLEGDKLIEPIDGKYDIVDASTLSRQLLKKHEALIAECVASEDNSIELTEELRKIFKRSMVYRRQYSLALIVREKLSDSTIKDNSEALAAILYSYKHTVCVKAAILYRLYRNDINATYCCCIEDYNQMVSPLPLPKRGDDMRYKIFLNAAAYYGVTDSIGTAFITDFEECMPINCEGMNLQLTTAMVARYAFGWITGGNARDLAIIFGINPKTFDEEYVKFMEAAQQLDINHKRQLLEEKVLEDISLISLKGKLFEMQEYLDKNPNAKKHYDSVGRDIDTGVRGENIGRLRAKGVDEGRDPRNIDKTEMEMLNKGDK